MELLIKQGTIWFKNNWHVGDILIEQGIIKEIAKKIESPGSYKIINAKGFKVIPGLIVMHVHLREPGYEEKETIETGLQAAAAGGITTIAVMPNTKPVTDNPERINYLIKKAKEMGTVKVLPIGAITKGEEGQKLTNFQRMKLAGVIGFSDDGRGIQSPSIMLAAMNMASELNIPIFAHCEDEEIAKNGVIHEGITSKKLNLPGIPSAAEFGQLQRDLQLAAKTGVHYHVCHISTKESVKLIKEAKERGVKVTCEVAPHHLLLTETDIKEPYSQYKMNPPLRSDEDRLALIEGLINGTIDIVATDHAPHTVLEKSQGLLKAPFGIVGLETAFPLLYTCLVEKNILSLEQLIGVMSSKAAAVFKLTGGEIEIGGSADITIVDLQNKKKVDPDKFLSKGKNTPFFGRELKGWPVYTIADGKIIYQQGRD